MIGEIVLFDVEMNEGVIEGEHKKYYDFHIGEWLESLRIRIGQRVIYEVEEDEARNITLDGRKTIEQVLHLKIELHLVE